MRLSPAALLSLALTLGTPLVLPALTPVARAEGNELPEKRPDDAVFSLEWGGGMSGAHGALELGAKGGTSTTGNHAGHTPDATVKFAVTPAELDALWKTLRENRLWEMPAKPAQVYDKGTTTVTVKWGKDGLCSFSDGQNSLTEEAAERFGKIVSALSAIEGKAVRAAEVDVLLVLDEAFAKTKHVVGHVLGRSTHPIIKSPEEEDWSVHQALERTVLRVLPGKIRLSGSADGKRLEPVTIDTADGRAFRLSVEGEKLVAKPFDAKGALVTVDAATAAKHGLPGASLSFDKGHAALTEDASGEKRVGWGGPPGGPLALTFEPYTGTTDKAADLVAARFPDRGYVKGATKSIYFGDDPQTVVTCVTGASLSRAWHFIVFFPKRNDAKEGVLVDLLVGHIQGDVPSPEDVLKMPGWGDLLRSVRVRFE